MSGLRAFRAPEGLREVKAYAFRQCLDLREVNFGRSLELFGSECFADSGIEKIEIPRGVAKVPAEVFRSCVRLREVTFASNSRCVLIGERAFAFACVLRRVELPEGLRTLGERAFERSGVEEVCLPRSL